MTKEEHDALVEMIVAIEMEKAERRYSTPDGRYPVCKNALGTWFCERCGQDVREYDGPCPAVPPENRWDMRET